MVSELLDINEGLAKEVVLVSAIIFIEDVHLDDFIFSRDIKGAFFFPDRVESAFLDLGSEFLALEDDNAIGVTFPRHIKCF